MIYLDNAATTQICGRAAGEVKKYTETYYGNPQSSYALGRISNSVMERAREIIAGMINASPSEIYFTAGGTEGDNFAVKQTCRKFAPKGRHVITTKIEHHAVINSCRAMEREGFAVTYLDTDRYGRVRPEDVLAALRRDTVLISVMHANNEVGTVEPVAAIGEIAKKRGIIFHTDTVQTFGHIPVDVKKFGADIICASAHKFNGPKGVGFMYVRDGLGLRPFIDGGMQESGMRAGTGNVAGVAGMAAAAKEASERMSASIAYERELRDYLIKSVITKIPRVKLNGHALYRLPNNVNLMIWGVDAGALAAVLDAHGICVSTGSACNTGGGPSHVLTALGMSGEEARSSLRISLSTANTRREIDFVVETLQEEVAALRAAAKISVNV